MRDVCFAFKQNISSVPFLNQASRIRDRLAAVREIDDVQL